MIKSKKMKKLLMVALFIGAICSCKKSSNSGSSNQNYCPTSAGSTWTYFRSSSDSVYKDSVYTFTATDSTKIIDNKTFTVFNSSTDSDVYYAVTDTDYFRTGSLLSGFGIPSLATFDELFLPINPTTASTWSTTLPITYNGTNYTATLNYTIPSVSDTLTVLNKFYSNLVDVHLAISTVISGFSVPLGGGDFYYGKGIGLVSFNVTTTIPTQSTITTTFNLQSYSIK